MQLKNPGMLNFANAVKKKMTDGLDQSSRQFITIMGCCLQRLCFAHYFFGGPFGLRSSMGNESLLDGGLCEGITVVSFL